MAEDSSECTVELLENSECDEQCNSKYCMWYRHGSTFTTPITMADEFGQLYAADNLECPYNASSGASLNYTLCTQSAAESIYIDPNTPEQNYHLCEASWIGDGICGMLTCLKDLFIR